MKFTATEIRVLNDIWAGTGCNYESLVRAYYRLMSEETLTIGYIKDIASMGIPVFKYISKIHGCPVDQVKGLIESKSIKSSVLKHAFESMTIPGVEFDSLEFASSKGMEASLTDSGLNDPIIPEEMKVADVTVSALNRFIRNPRLGLKRGSYFKIVSDHSRVCDGDFFGVKLFNGDIVMASIDNPKYSPDWIILPKYPLYASKAYLENSGQSSANDQKEYGLIVKKEFAEKHPELISSIKNIIENVIADDKKYKPFSNLNTTVGDVMGCSQETAEALAVSFRKIKAISGSNKSSGSSERPPLGIMPRKIWEEQRISVLMETISQYLKSGKLVKEEWVYELNELLYSRTDREA
ncbi:hypothetical protein [Dyadobacter sp. LHD-138]|uniref:hypothetical protein n=1 Tax=Dyadobacter sp. LHD-138 TaxID=3071413 RepID=UPI0027E1D79A|nr:hypothetical protein [Dyadobacter sp. LHD-138]MDQ6481606.1 hypothetical protein [Dyadobacter sp. LHD-138]